MTQATKKPMARMPGPVILAWRKAGQLLCRHSYVLVIARDRMFLRCDSCGAQSVGFVVGRS